LAELRILAGAERVGIGSAGVMAASGMHRRAMLKPGGGSAKDEKTRREKRGSPKLKILGFFSCGR